MSADSPRPCAGIVFRAGDKYLLIRRSDTGEWEFPGGHELEGETPLENAMREASEEIGPLPDAAPKYLKKTANERVAYTTFLCDTHEEFIPTLSDENNAWVWAEYPDWPQPMLPPCLETLNEIAGGEFRQDHQPRVPTELEIAESIRDDPEHRPVHIPNNSFYAIRITGTGASYRTAHKEYVWRDPSIYLNERFLQRCNGVPVIFEHPDKSMLTSAEYAARNVGTIILPYIDGDEVWGIARIIDADTITILKNRGMSTSPGVMFGNLSDSSKIEIDDDYVILIEGNPSFIDHIAICAAGVWDKLGQPDGVAVDLPAVLGNDLQEDQSMADEVPAWAADAFGRMMERLDAMNSRMDSTDKKMDESFAKWASEEAKEKEHKDAQARKDAAAVDEKTKKDADDAAEKARKDAEAAVKARIDAVEEAVKNARPEDRSDADVAEMADVQSRFDSVAMSFGKQARSPMSGETPTAYRRRLAAEFQQYSPAWKNVDLSKLPPEALRIAESAIRTDAQIAARSPADLPPGQLRAIKRRTPAGHQITEWFGDIDGWLAAHRSPSRTQFKMLPVNERRA